MLLIPAAPIPASYFPVAVLPDWTTTSQSRSHSSGDKGTVARLQ